MNATVVRTGTAKRGSRQIEEDLRRIGADLSSNAGADTSAISVCGTLGICAAASRTGERLAREAAFPGCVRSKFTSSSSARFAFELRFGKRRFRASSFHQSEKRRRKFRESANENRAGVRPGVRGKIRSDAPQIFFDLAARALRGSRSNDRCGHFRQSRRAIGNRRVADRKNNSP